MPEFLETESARMIKKTVNEFIDREVRPLEEDIEHLLNPDFRRLDEDGFIKDEVVEKMDTVRRRAGEEGLYGMHLPEEEGGGGFDLVTLAHMIMEIYETGGLGLNIHINENAPGCHPNLLHMDESLKDKFLRPLIRGEKSSCFALTESTSGSDSISMKTRAEKDGDDWVINGTKQWITNAPYADFGQVFAVTDPEKEGTARVSAFLFETDQPGVSINRINQTLLNDGMQAEVEFDDCRVPSEYMLGERGKGFHQALEFINSGRVRIGARCAGLMKKLLDHTVEYANQRTSWGKPIGKRQYVRDMITDIAIFHENLVNLTLKTAQRIDSGESPVKMSSMIKYYAAEKLCEAGDNAVQVFGGNGLTHDYPVERIFRYGRMLRIPEGTSEIQKETIAREIGL